MKKTSNDRSGALGCATFVVLIPAMLKLMGIITWPWAWALAPIWLTAAFVFLVIILDLIINKRP